MRIWLGFLLAIAAGGDALAGPPTHGEVASRLLNDLLAPVARSVQEEGYAKRIALRSEDYTEGDLEDSVAGFFFDRGFDVWVLEPGAAPPEAGVVVLDLEMGEASVKYPESDDGTLGLGSRRLLRLASASMSATLEDPSDGRRLWRGSPEARYEDWIRESEKSLLAADQPGWLSENQASGLGSSRAAWKEKATVLGLLGGVILLYFAGAN